MWYYTGIKSRGLNRHIQHLARYLHSCGADLSASTPIIRTSGVRNNVLTFSWEISSNPDLSIVDLSYFALLSNFRTDGKIFSPQNYIPMPYDMICSIGTNIDRSFLNRVGEQGERGHELSTRSGFLDFVTSDPSTAEIISGKHPKYSLNVLQSSILLQISI